MADRLDDADDKPLDPAVADVQRKLRRLVLISALTFGLGFVAVLFAIIWRVVNPGGEEDAPAGAPFSTAAELPAGATIIDTTLDGDRLGVLVDVGGARRLLIYEATSGRLVGSVDFLAR